MRRGMRNKSRNGNEGGKWWNKRGEEAGPHPLNVEPSMNPLEVISWNWTLSAQANQAFLQLELKFGQLHQYYPEQRNYIIQNIPGFWSPFF